MRNADFAQPKAPIDSFRDHVAQRLANEISEEDFNPLRMKVGLHLQRLYAAGAGAQCHTDRCVIAATGHDRRSLGSRL